MHLIGFILGPVSLRVFNLAAHESGWLDKGDFLPVALSWQSEPWCCSPQERFSVPDGCLLLSIANPCKKQLALKISLGAPRQTPNLYFVLLTGENVFSLLAGICKFSLRPLC